MAHLSGDEKRRYVAEMFARISPRYDLMNSLMTGGLHRRWKRATARTDRGERSRPGSGRSHRHRRSGFRLADCPNLTEVVGVDLLPEMLTIASRRQASRSGHGRSIQFVRGDALQLPFPDASFIGATAGFSLRNMPDVASAIQEMARVVAPGGRVTTLELTPMAPGIASSMGRFYFHRLVPLMGQIVAGDRTAYTYLPDSVDYFLTADGLVDVFRQAGLVDVGYRRLGFGGVALHFGNQPG